MVCHVHLQIKAVKGLLFLLIQIEHSNLLFSALTQIENWDLMSPAGLTANAAISTAHVESAVRQDTATVSNLLSKTGKQSKNQTADDQLALEFSYLFSWPCWPGERSRWLSCRGRTDWSGFCHYSACEGPARSAVRQGMQCSSDSVTKSGTCNQSGPTQRHTGQPSTTH